MGWYLSKDASRFYESLGTHWNNTENLRDSASPLLDGFSPLDKLFPLELTGNQYHNFYFQYPFALFMTPWSGRDLIDQNEILVEIMLLEFVQTAPEKEVPEISEESLFSWDFLPSLHLNMSK